MDAATGGESDARSRSPLRLSADRRYLVEQGDGPFFFLADTAWAIVWKGTPDQWARYLDHRARLGFSVVQVSLLPWRWGFTDVEGHRPFIEGDPARPNDAYFARFDQFLELAAARGLFTCLMVIWGGNRPTLPAVNFSTEQAVAFTRYAVARFAHFPMLWSLSGDAPYAEDLDKWEAVGAAVEAADPNGHPTTNHLPPSMNWRFLHHDSPWHDFHMLQTGHRQGVRPDVAALPAAYYAREPVKAVVNGEPWYEAHPSRDTREYGPAFTAADARWAFWTSVLSGATMGHTYGGQGIWNWKRPGDSEEELAGPQIGPPWSEALNHPGAAQCGLGATFLRGLPWWRLRPAPERTRRDPALDPTGPPACAHVPGEWWLAYWPGGRGQLLLLGLEEGDWRARWFDPRGGEERPLGTIHPAADGVWRAPETPTLDDWLLVLSREDR